MALDVKEKFSGWTVFFHWAVALIIISLLTVGIYMEENKVYWLYTYHKSFGVLIFLIILARVFWRIKNGWPTPINTQHAFELKLARMTHWILIAGSVLFPISGMMMSAAGGKGIPLFGFELLAKNCDPAIIDKCKTLPINEIAKDFGSTMHYWLGWIMIVTITLHIAGALKHHFVYKDGTLRRMLGKKVDS